MANLKAPSDALTISFWPAPKNKISPSDTLRDSLVFLNSLLINL